ncbi:hypothetical protein CSOJ01_04465 [Colletotrichum sojae]|uniref:Uncharacterized protein n=1 Tax=Colletotrichum sojae TaxID=2175907 RepID=A0A8H6MYH9_9PEZI|nr:hypothetical protein CSOJ01_04465 [Colletotrichum sojae]
MSIPTNLWIGAPEVCLLHGVSPSSVLRQPSKVPDQPGDRASASRDGTDKIDEGFWHDRVTRIVDSGCRSCLFARNKARRGGILVGLQAPSHEVTRNKSAAPRTPVHLANGVYETGWKDDRRRTISGGLVRWEAYEWRHTVSEARP